MSKQKKSKQTKRNFKINPALRPFDRKETSLEMKYIDDAESTPTSSTVDLKKRGLRLKLDLFKKTRQRKKIKALEEMRRKELALVNKFLNENEEFLDVYVSENIQEATVERWVRQKREARERMFSKRRLARQFFIVSGTITELEKCLTSLQTDEDMLPRYLSKYLCAFLHGATYRVFKLYHGSHNFVHVLTLNLEYNAYCTREIKYSLDRVEATLATHITEIAELGISITLSRKSDFERVPFVLPEVLEYLSYDEMVALNYVCYVPIKDNSGKAIYIVEVFRSEPYSDLEMEHCKVFIPWASAALNCSNCYLDINKKKDIAAFLIEYLKLIFVMNITSNEQLEKILEFAQYLVKADRASLFLVDHRSQEIISSIFDYNSVYAPGTNIEIRLPIDLGIVGCVVTSGQIINIPDAYSDDRFNCKIDEATGYKTKSILGVPIIVHNKVIGVVEMLNKLNGTNFSHQDELLLKLFLGIFGIAISNAKLHDLIRTEGNIKEGNRRNETNLHAISYHYTSSEEEAEDLVFNTRRSMVNLYDFYLDPTELNEMEKCKAILDMYCYLFSVEAEDISEMLILARFVLTVKRNYRRVEYHNFNHGWAVAQSIFVILNHDRMRRFNSKQRLALFIAALCHDIDHNGYTNEFLIETKSHLASVYTKSPLENYHSEFTTTILKEEDHNILHNLSSQDYDDVLVNLKECILATDINSFNTTFHTIRNLLSGVNREVTFRWRDPLHKKLAMEMVIIAADYAATAKPWEVQFRTAIETFNEFYELGDRERSTGRIPKTMMDRRYPEEKFSYQVDFLTSYAIPCYTVLQNILPHTRPMLYMAVTNLEYWKLYIDRLSQKRRKKLQRSSNIDLEDGSDKSNGPENTEVVDSDGAKASTSIDTVIVKPIPKVHTSIHLPDTDKSDSQPGAKTDQFSPKYEPQVDNSNIAPSKAESISPSGVDLDAIEVQEEPQTYVYRGVYYPTPKPKPKLEPEVVNCCGFKFTKAELKTHFCLGNNKHIKPTLVVQSDFSDTDLIPELNSVSNCIDVNTTKKQVKYQFSRTIILVKSPAKPQYEQQSGYDNLKHTKEQIVSRANSVTYTDAEFDPQPGSSGLKYPKPSFHYHQAELRFEPQDEHDDFATEIESQSEPESDFADKPDEELQTDTGPALSEIPKKDLHSEPQPDQQKQPLIDPCEIKVVVTECEPESYNVVLQPPLYLGEFESSSTGAIKKKTNKSYKETEIVYGQNGEGAIVDKNYLKALCTRSESVERKLVKHKTIRKKKNEVKQSE